MATIWYVDKGLNALIGQAKQKWLGITVGTVGDLAHQAEPSDHNPSTAKHDKGAVDAADFMLGKVFDKAAAQWFVNALVKYRDRRIAYIIWNGRIIASYAVGNVKAWVWRTYNGADKHTNHVHVSVNDLHESDGSDWKLEEPKVATAAKPDPRSWDSDVVLGINFFFAEAYRAATGKASKPGPGDDRSARNALAYINTVMDYANAPAPEEV